MSWWIFLKKSVRNRQSYKINSVLSKLFSNFFIDPKIPRHICLFFSPVLRELTSLEIQYLVCWFHCMFEIFSLFWRERQHFISLFPPTLLKYHEATFWNRLQLNENIVPTDVCSHTHTHTHTHTRVHSCGQMVIVARNGHAETSSNSEFDSLHFI